MPVQDMYQYTGTRYEFYTSQAHGSNYATGYPGTILLETMMKKVHMNLSINTIEMCTDNPDWWPNKTGM